MKPVKALRIVTCLAAAALLAACAAEEPVEQCEPGVKEMSEMGTVTPSPGC